MLSRWYDKKEKSIELRKRGLSIGNIESKLGIPRSTLSGWFKKVQLTKRQREKLRRRWENGLVKAREKASQWHRGQKEIRLIKAEEEAHRVINNLNFKDRNISELALAMLYMGEGIKSNSETGMGNSDPLLLKAFLQILRNNYDLDVKKIRCELYLRADQNADTLKKFWSNELKLPLENFKYIHFDKRTIGTKTFPDYKGVCMVRCSNVAIQRKLLNISRRFCEKITAG